MRSSVRSKRSVADESVMDQPVLVWRTNLKSGRICDLHEALI